MLIGDLPQLGFPRGSFSSFAGPWNTMDRAYPPQLTIILHPMGRAGSKPDIWLRRRRSEEPHGSRGQDARAQRE